MHNTNQIKRIIHHNIFTGTLILTTANLISRILGFLNKLYIAKIFSEESLGILQLTLPVSMFFFSICAIGMQSAISRFTASHGKNNNCSFLLAGVLFAFGLSLISSTFLYNGSLFISSRILLEKRCAPLLRIYALSLPLSTLHACLCGYFYGRQKASYPAISQVLEQTVRIIFLYSFVSFSQSHGISYGLSIAIIGNLLGELVSTAFCIISLLFYKPSRIHFQNLHLSLQQTKRYKYYMEQTIFSNKLLLSHAIPISCNRVLISCFSSIEATFIPNRFMLYGYSKHDALSLYGVLTGMAFPIIFFPASILNAACILILPAIAKAQALKNFSRIRKTLLLSSCLTILIGIFSGTFFVFFGSSIGFLLFKNDTAGTFLHILGYLCPILYLPGVLTSILNGLGQTKKTLLFHIISILIRLYFILFFIPKAGIRAYFSGVFLSHFVLSALNFLALRKYIVYNEPGLSENEIRKESHHGI